jgi:hypothetical protein
MRIMTTSDLNYVSGGWYDSGYSCAADSRDLAYLRGSSSSGGQMYCSDYLTPKQYQDLATWAGMGADAIKHKMISTGMSLVQIYATYCGGPD